jgi:subtilisin
MIGMNIEEPIKLIPDFNVEARVSILAETVDYNHKMMNIPEMWQKTQGKGIKVVVLDSGIPKHLDLLPEGGKSFIPNYSEDKNGHATHCAGIIAGIANNNMGIVGIAPDVDDYYGAVLGADGSGSIKSIIDGIMWAVDEIHANIISMSLGISARYPTVKQFEDACNYAHEKGVAIFAAAGNEYGKVGQPAKYDSVFAVAAVDNKKQHAKFSNTGPEVDFATGGVNVYSTYLNNSYAKLSGTSMACPALAGVAALILADATVKLSPDELKKKIEKIAYDVGPKGFDETYGHGIPIFGKHPEKDKKKENWFIRFLRRLFGL